MPVISDNDIIKINESDHAISCILKYESNFNEVAYKVLQNQEKYGILKCNKSSQNGKIKLVYDITKFKPLHLLISSLSRQNFLTILSNLKSVIEQIKENGFIRCENTFTDPEKIFVDVEKLSVYMICMPISEISIHKSIQEFNSTLINSISSVAKHNPSLIDIDINYNITGIVEPSNPSSQLESPENPKPLEPQYILKAITLKPVNNSNQTKLIIDKPEFLIGALKESVDGVISDDRTISKKHCKIINDGKKVYIQDMGSLNGTYVNGRKLLQEQKAQIRKGYIIQLSKMEFLVE